jgi:DNA polymerase-1
MLLDGNSLAFRAFYALPAENFKTKNGLTTNAVYGFTAMLINLLRDEAPTHIAAAFDVSRQTFRAERFPEYKATRSATPDEFRGQIDITRLRGRRHHRHPGDPGRRGRLPGAGGYRRP